MSVALRNLTPDQGIGIVFESSTDLKTWGPRHDLLVHDSDQSSLPIGFTRWRFAFDPENETTRFVRIAVTSSE